MLVENYSNSRVRLPSGAVPIFSGPSPNPRWQSARTLARQDQLRRSLDFLPSQLRRLLSDSEKNSDTALRLGCKGSSSTLDRFPTPKCRYWKSYGKRFLLASQGSKNCFCNSIETNGGFCNHCENRFCNEVLFPLLKTFFLLLPLAPPLRESNSGVSLTPVPPAGNLPG